VRKLIDQGVLTPANVANAAIIKTLVTTDLQKAIAPSTAALRRDAHRLQIHRREARQLRVTLPKAAREKYRQLTEAETRDLRLKHSTYYVAGGEESYGYSAHDFVRDKDGNAAVVLFAEVCAYAKSRGLTVDAYLDEIYADVRLLLEKNGTLTFEGADGAAKIAKLATSYAKQPPKQMDWRRRPGARDFKSQTFKDVEGDTLPKESMVIFRSRRRTPRRRRPPARSRRSSSTCSPRRDPKGPSLPPQNSQRRKRKPPPPSTASGRDPSRRESAALIRVEDAHLCA
jgi:phosphoglucomutase